MADSIEYGQLMHQAMRDLIRKVLAEVSDNGLPGDHHFFITFTTSAPGVGIPDRLRERYPADMTIVLQNWFDDLVVREDGFAVTLNFGSTPERLEIPFDSLVTFVDPSVEFGLRFETAEEDEDDGESIAEAPMAENVEPPAKGDAEIVSLDKFRK